MTKNLKVALLSGTAIVLLFFVIVLAMALSPVPEGMKINSCVVVLSSPFVPATQTAVASIPGCATAYAEVYAGTIAAKTSIPSWWPFGH